ncbi:metal-dependent hydrolase [bacterium]|nr:metal-dependent hydrolase [bacterium]
MMPLPFGHSFMGYALYEAAECKEKRLDWRLISLFVFVANAPDLDFIPGFFVGDPNRYHHHYLSHSLGFAIFVGAAVAAVLAFRGERPFWRNTIILTLVCFSHMILDFFTADTSQPYGLPIFWPLTGEYFYSPISIFMSVHKGGANLEFLRSLFVWHNFWVILWEIVVLAAAVALARILKLRTSWFRFQLKRTV